MSTHTSHKTRHAMPRYWRLRWSIAVLLLLLLQSRVLAQASTVFGTITYRDGSPAVNILVFIGQGYRYSDVGGRYKIEGVPAGLQHMVCKRGPTILWQGDVHIAGAQMKLDQRMP